MTFKSIISGLVLTNKLLTYGFYIVNITVPIMNYGRYVHLIDDWRYVYTCLFVPFISLAAFNDSLHGVSLWESYVERIRVTSICGFLWFLKRSEFHFIDCCSLKKNYLLQHVYLYILILICHFYDVVLSTAFLSWNLYICISKICFFSLTFIKNVDIDIDVLLE